MDNAQDDTPFRLTHGIVGNTVGMIKEGSQVVAIPGGVFAVVVIVVVVIVVVVIVLAAARFIQYHYRLGITTTRTRATSTTSTVGYSGFRCCSGMGRVRDKARINQGHVFWGQGTR